MESDTLFRISKENEAKKIIINAMTRSFARGLCPKEKISHQEIMDATENTPVVSWTMSSLDQWLNYIEMQSKEITNECRSFVNQTCLSEWPEVFELPDCKNTPKFSEE